jgi:hypothetical protein
VTPRPGEGQQTPSPTTAPSPTGSESFAAVGTSETSLATPIAGYIDSAIPFTHFKLRFDAAYDINRPDRAEFFYAKCGCFAVGHPFVNAPGPRLSETRVDYQDISSYVEVALDKRFSCFVEAPFRFLNPEQNANTAGFADMNFGFKYAMIAEPDQYFTFQLRTYIPTGDAGHGLGTDHVSLEPALLFYKQLSKRFFLEGEVRDFIPIGGTDFAGNVFSYGASLSYLLFDTGHVRVFPVAEILGWTVLSGREFAFPENVVVNAAGDTIVNAKFGVRVGFGESTMQGFLSRADMYVGYGTALTGDFWYRDILRMEFRLRF